MTVIARGLIIQRDSEKNAEGRYVAKADGSKCLMFSEKLTSFQNVSDNEGLCSRFA